MRPIADEMSDPSRFRILDEIDHDNLVPAIQRHFRPTTPVKVAYLLANAAVGAVLVFRWVKAGPSFLEGFPNLCLGMVLGYLILLPIHELVHSLAYRMLGATTTKVVYHWKTLNAYCVADRFVVNGREFLIVCLAPFVVLNAILIAAIGLVGGFPVFLWGMLLLHVGACSGDFALASFAWMHRRDGLQTYDDVTAKRSYFYGAA